MKTSVNTLGRRGFTLIEMMVACVITAFVLSSVAMSLSQLSRAKSTCKERLDAHLRADTAVAALRRDIATIIRTDDLFWTRLLIVDDTVPTALGQMDRDELLVFNHRLRPIRDIDFSGEGLEYETQYRIEEDELGPALWRRRDAVPDEYLLGGGIAAPLVEGIVGLSIEAYDGNEWYHEWDSDYDGLPLAVRLTVIASGHRTGDDVYDAPLAVLGTVIPIVRVLSPADLLELDEEPESSAEEALEAEEAETAEDLEGGVAPPGGRQRGRGQDPRTPGSGFEPPSGSPGARPGGGQNPGSRRDQFRSRRGGT